MKKLVLIVLLIGLLVKGNSQAFTNVAVEENVLMFNFGASALGVGLSFYDYDHDGWDDFTFSSLSDSLVLYRNLEGNGFQRFTLCEPSSDAKSPVWVDYDNDGDSDFIWTKRSSGTRLYRNDGNMVFTDVTANLNIPDPLGVHIYGANWGDYDRDGFLDVYLSTYNYFNGIYNYLLHNNGDGTFTNVAPQAGVSNGLKASFEGVWHDFNFDGWPDLYVINDLSQGNDLYINDGDGTFTDMTTFSGLKGIDLQSMSNSISDFDNDGDWDVYVTNTAPGNAFFVNNGSMVYSEMAAQAGVTVNTWCWGAKWIDYDNNLLEDLYVATTTTFQNQDYFYINNGDGTFTDPQFPEFSTVFAQTFASGKGDFNNDGYYDLVISAQGDSCFQIMKNNGGTNNWAKLSLQGVWSNRDAVGTYIQYYVGGNRYLKYTACGEDFIAQDSQHEILAMGQYESIDSLIITWPRGLVEKLYDIPASSWLHLVEGANTNIGLIANNDGVLCGAETISISVDDYASYLWSTGETSQSIAVDSAGLYTVVVMDENGFQFTDELLVIQQDTPVYEIITTELDCWYSEDGVIDIMHEGSDDVIVWDDLSTDFTRTGLSEGEYSFTIMSIANCESSQTVSLIAPQAIEAAISSTPVSCHDASDGTISIEPSGGTGNLTIDWNGIDPLQLAADDYSITVTDQLGCDLELNIEITEPPAITANVETDDVTCFGLDNGMIVIVPSGGVGPYNIDWQGVDPENVPPGDFTAIIYDDTDCQKVINYSINEPALLSINFTTSNVTCPGGNDGTVAASVVGGTGNTSVDWNGLNADALPAGTYTVEAVDENSCQTSEQFTITDPDDFEPNLITEEASDLGNGWASVTPGGGTPPYTYWWTNNDTDSLAQDLEQGDYSCYILDAAGCEFILDVTIGFNGVAENNSAGNWQLYPVPATDFLYLNSANGRIASEIRVTDVTGKVVLSVYRINRIEISSLSAGTYVLTVSDGDEIQTMRFVKD
ncbi:MAG: FG-GAP-like repeat-containing protein [Flavobacteriales bacterium]